MSLTKIDTATVAIRHMRDSDREDIIDLQWALNLFEDAVSNDRVTDRASAAACVDSNLSQTCTLGGATLLAESDGRTIGYLSLCFAISGNFVRPERRRHGYIQDIVVQPELRGQGIAQLLLREAERITRAEGLATLSLGMLAGNDTAERAYKRFGFTPHSVTMVKEL
jgi:GNAT superfamily N-acetyltransferase